MAECFFCNCIEKQDFELENDLAFSIMDGYPVSNGYMLFITKRHVKDWWETTIEEKLAIFNLIDEAKKKIDAKYNPDGYNIGMNLGKDAGQTIMHIHVHLIPRYNGDMPNPRGGVRGVIPEKR